MHSAFLVMAFNRNNELMLTRRSYQKKLWPGFWDGSVASHYFKDGSADDAIRKRMRDEIGLSIPFTEYLFNFRYHARYRDIGSENELCDVYKVENICPEEVTISRSEVSACRFAKIEDVKKEVNEAGETFTPWFILAFQKYLENKV